MVTLFARIATLRGRDNPQAARESDTGLHLPGLLFEENRPMATCGSSRAGDRVGRRKVQSWHYGY